MIRISNVCSCIYFTFSCKPSYCAETLLCEWQHVVPHTNLGWRLPYHDREGNLSLMRYIASFPNNKAIIASYHYFILNHVSIRYWEEDLQGVKLWRIRSKIAKSCKESCPGGRQNKGWWALSLPGGSGEPWGSRVRVGAASRILRPDPAAGAVPRAGLARGAGEPCLHNTLSQLRNLPNPRSQGPWQR